MYGIIFAELQGYVQDRLGAGAWSRLLEHAGLPGRHYVPHQAYPDSEALAVVTAATQLTGKPAQDLLEDFGFFIGPTLLQTYVGYLKSEWKTLDVIEHTEAVVHKVVRRQLPGAAPPYLACRRERPDRVVIEYTSQRRMCAIARGIVRGLATHFGEQVARSETSCMLRGDPRCLIVVDLLPQPAPRQGK
jgi:Haem-NO-binding